MFNLATLTTAELQEERDLASEELRGETSYTDAFKRIAARLTEIDRLLIARRAADVLPLAA